MGQDGHGRDVVHAIRRDVGLLVVVEPVQAEAPPWHEALQLLQCSASLPWGQWAAELLQYTAALPGGSGLQLLQYTAALPGGSGQCNSNSCNALPHCLGAVGGATSTMHSLTAWGQWAVQLLQCTASLPWGQWAVQLLQCTASLPGGSGQWNSCNAPPHCLGAVVPRLWARFLPFLGVRRLAWATPKVGVPCFGAVVCFGALCCVVL